MFKQIRVYSLRFIVYGFAKYNSKLKTRKAFLNSFQTALFIIVLIVCPVYSGLFGISYKSPIPNYKPYYSITRVVIDAGHGGHDSGCLGSKTKEKDVALAVALKLGKYIEDHFHDVKVIYTRKTDVFVELHERAEIANNAKADLFICIHCNSACYRDKKKKKEICSEGSFGVETWVMGLHVAGANLEVAKRENSAVLLEKDYTKKYDGFDPDSPEANIIFSLYQNTYLDQSLKLASFVENEVKKNGREPRGVKQAGFLVLYKTNMPSVLVETGFLTNPPEEAYLSSSKGQDAIAHSIFNAFKSYKTSVEIGEVPEIEVHNSKPTDTNMHVKDTTAIVARIMKIDSAVSIAPKPDSNSLPKKRNAEAIKKKNEDENLPNTDDSIYFSVQILLSKNSLSSKDAKFKGVKNIQEENISNVYKYTTGRVKTFQEATNLRTVMQNKGFKDAFVVTYKNGKRFIPVKAKEEVKKK